MRRKKISKKISILKNKNRKKRKKKKKKKNLSR